MNTITTSTTMYTPAHSAELRELASSLASLLETARTELERNREVARASIAKATSLLQVEIDRHAGAPGRQEASGGLAGWQINRVRAYVDAHLDETILVSDLSAVAHRSSTYFSRAFKRSFGETPHAYLVRRRLDRASQLMLSSDAPISDIALSCGFSDQAHLCKLFRRAIGQSPAAWRREHREAARTGSTANRHIEARDSDWSSARTGEAQGRYEELRA